MKAKIIKSESEYEEALARVESLMDAKIGSSEENELEILALLIEKYEEEQYPIDLPDPIDAIIFRMDQEGLIRKDMREYIGSQSKVSEVLNRKRPLSLRMIRNLYDRLGIPAEVLLQDTGKDIGTQNYDYRQYPFTEMFNRGYFPAYQYALNEAKEYSEEILSNFFSVFGGKMPQHVYCRKTDRDIGENALFAWQAKVLTTALQEELPFYNDNVLNKAFLQEIVHLSYYSKGPQLAKELLNKKGIHFVTARHLPKTYLDGACFYSPTGRPVIGMTLRHDRLDNFWFTLIHELAHVLLHLPKESHVIFDNTDPRMIDKGNPQEVEADRLTYDCLIPPERWEGEKAKFLSTDQERVIIDFAEDLQISPAIVAGRVRWDSGEYTKFSKLVGTKKVRCLFPEYD
jgi:HTH-type transcriptional regulator/antitoxin HigA